jgi:hypothetical protein
MWVLAILHAENIIVKMENKLRNNPKSTLCSIKCKAKIRRVLAFLCVDEIEMKIKNTLRINLKSALFSPKLGAEIRSDPAVLRGKNIKTK